MQSFSHFILRCAGAVSIAGSLLAIVGCYYSIELYKNLRTNVEELLPTSSRSVLDLAEITRRLRSIDNIAVLVFSKDTVASRKFVNDMVHQIESLPKSLVSSVEYKITQELKYFKDRQALYLDLSDLTRVRDYIRDRIEFEKELYNPFNLFRTDELPEPKFDFQHLKQKYLASTSIYERFPGGYYATQDETKRAILVYLAGHSSIDRAIELRKKIDEEIKKLEPEQYAKDLEIRFTGGLQNNIEEHNALIEDLGLSTIIVIVVVTLAMLLFFKNIRATLALIVSLFMGTFWTFGVSYYVVGYLNANSAFLGSIVIGNGINFGIIFLARYLEERRKGRKNSRAVRLSMGHTAISTWTAALAAGLAYGSLILTGFRGFRQFGVIGLIGMVLCWLSAFTLLPAFLTLLDKISPLEKRTKRVREHIIFDLVAKVISQYPRWIWGFSFIITLVSAAMLARYNPDIIETNLSNLRNKESLTQGSGYHSKNLDEIFQRYLSPLAILPQSGEEAAEIAEALREIQQKEKRNSLISHVQTLGDFVPEQQYEKIKVLREIRSSLKPKILEKLSPSEKKQIHEFLTPAVFRSIYQKDLPKLLVEKFSEKDGSLGKLVLVEPPLESSQWNGHKLNRFVQIVRETADSVKKGTPVAGSLTIMSDIIQAVAYDGPRATVFALISVVLLVIFLFRNFNAIFLTLFALGLGILWLFGIILGFWLKINFLNFIALPITFGIGVDYGVNIFQRYRQEGGGNIIAVIRETGGAVTLCSFTTIIGYSSLLIARNQGFVSFGLLAVAGELTCVFAAVVALPAYLQLRYKKTGSKGSELR